MMVPLFILILLLGLVLVGCQATRVGYESAPYKVVRSEGEFEVRDYPALMMVETPMAAANGGDGSFMRLFRFITGANEGKQKIAMTTPVFMSGSATNATMAFVLPAKLKTGEVPKPADGAVTVRELAAGPGIVVLCGRFEGFDERIFEGRAVEEVSIGDVILSGGEVAAMACVSARGK